MTTKQLASLFIFNTLLLSAEVNANQRWYVVNDSVMGGVCNVSLKNNGGFASIRTELNTQGQNANTINLRVKGDGQTYQLRLRTSNYLDGPAYTHSFKTIENEWTNINFTPSDFTLAFRGRTLTQQPVIDFSDIRQLGFMIAGKQAGKFKLEIAHIEFAD